LGEALGEAGQQARHQNLLPVITIYFLNSSIY
jgi:hypothetical protein